MSAVGVTVAESVIAAHIPDLTLARNRACRHLLRRASSISFDSRTSSFDCGSRWCSFDDFFKPLSYWTYVGCDLLRNASVHRSSVTV